jgi:hypothetical protein
MAGGLNRAFRTPSLVWQTWQLLVPVAIVDEDGKKKTRRRTDHKTNIAFINTPRRSYRQLRTMLFAVNKKVTLSARHTDIRPQIVGIFKEI